MNNLIIEEIYEMSSPWHPRVYIIKPLGYILGASGTSFFRIQVLFRNNNSKDAYELGIVWLKAGITSIVEHPWIFKPI